MAGGFSSWFALGSAILEGGEGDVQLGQVTAVGGLELFNGSDAAREGLWGQEVRVNPVGLQDPGLCQVLRHSFRGQSIGRETGIDKRNREVATTRLRWVLKKRPVLG